MNSGPDSLLIIAEAAQGYEGDPGLAHALVRAASGAGADAVKFQLVYADELCTTDYEHHNLFRSLEMADSVWRGLADYARERKVALMLDVFGPRSLALAVSVGAAAIKIHSTDMSNIGLLREVAASPMAVVLLSTGGCLRNEIIEALAILAAKDLVLLHGYQGYPTPLEANQVGRLSALHALVVASGRSKPTRMGFADHVPCDDPLRFILAASALGLGARVLEKHITLAQAMKMEDHESALNPDDFAHFVAAMRHCIHAITPGIARAPDFDMHKSEHAYRAKTRKHVVALRPLAAGTVIVPDMVGLKRTPAKRSMSDLREVYGKRLARDVPVAAALTPELLVGKEQ